MNHNFCLCVSSPIYFIISDRNYIEMGYVPSHLHHICFELFKNSMRATVETHGSFDVPSVKVLLTKGKDNVCIKISDRGGGASLEECRRWTHYMYSTAPPPPKVLNVQTFIETNFILPCDR